MSEGGVLDKKVDRWLAGRSGGDSVGSFRGVDMLALPTRLPPTSTVARSSAGGDGGDDGGSDEGLDLQLNPLFSSFLSSSLSSAPAENEEGAGTPQRAGKTKPQPIPYLPRTLS